MDDPRVCFVVNAVGETSVPADIARALQDHTDVEVDILAWFEARSFEGDDQIDVICVDAPDTTVGVDWNTIHQVRTQLRSYDLIQTHHNHSGAFAKLLAESLRIPSVSREGNMRKGFNRLGRVVNGLTNPLADRVVCNSHAVYDSFTRWEDAILPASKVVFIPNGVDFDRLEAGRNLDWSVRDAGSVSGDFVLIGTAGMLTEQKDHATLIRALKRARTRTDKRLDLVIAGDGPLRSTLERLVVDLDLEDSVHFLGYLDRLQVYKMLSETDVYAMPSRWEGFSAAAVEALAAGNAAVFSDIPPFTEPYDGLARFHPVGDHETLANRIVDLADDTEHRNKMAANARSHVEQNYAMGSVAKQYRDLYGEILRAR